MGLNCVNFVIISLEELYVSFFFFLPLMYSRISVAYDHIFYSILV